MWFTKIDEFTCQGSKVTPETLKIQFKNAACFFLLDILKFQIELAMGLQDMHHFQTRMMKFLLSSYHLSSSPCSH